MVWSAGFEPEGISNKELKSLEQQCMDMAKAAPKLLETHVRFPSGEQVEYVIADPIKGGVVDAALMMDSYFN